mgnify:CR=1 FL=1
MVLERVFASNLVNAFKIEPDSVNAADSSLNSSFLIRFTQVLDVRVHHHRCRIIRAAVVSASGDAAFRYLSSNTRVMRGTTAYLISCAVLALRKDI